MSATPRSGQLSAGLSSCRSKDVVRPSTDCSAALSRRSRASSAIRVGEGGALPCEPSWELAPRVHSVTATHLPEVRGVSTASPAGTVLITYCAVAPARTSYVLDLQLLRPNVGVRSSPACTMIIVPLHTISLCGSTVKRLFFA